MCRRPKQRPKSFQIACWFTWPKWSTINFGWGFFLLECCRSQSSRNETSRGNGGKNNEWMNFSTWCRLFGAGIKYILGFIVALTRRTRQLVPVLSSFTFVHRLYYPHVFWFFNFAFLYVCVDSEFTAPIPWFDFGEIMNCRRLCNLSTQFLLLRCVI